MKKIMKSLGLLSLMIGVSVLGFGSNFAQAVNYTASDVAAHNTQASCWVIIDNTVYDLTNFIPLHPGGPAIIISICGMDASSVFPHSANTLNALSSYVIGTLGATPVLTTINVTPTTPSVVVGNTQQMVATTLDQNGAAIAATVVWTSSNPAIGTINSTTGLFTAVSAGSTTLTATSGSVTGATVATVSVVTPTPTDHHEDNDDEDEDSDKEDHDDEDRDRNRSNRSERKTKENVGEHRNNNQHKNRRGHND
ncbi:MAG: cytochrome b5 domain-containing protein [Candidatus Paceibacterota bacterium]|jgi:uncharacterized protein YjdB